MIQIGQVVHYVTADGGEYDALITAVFHPKPEGSAEPVVNLAIVDPIARGLGEVDRAVRQLRTVLHESAPNVVKSLAGIPVNCWRHATGSVLDNLPELPAGALLGADNGKGTMQRLASWVCRMIHEGSDPYCRRHEARGAELTIAELEAAGIPRGATEHPPLSNPIRTGRRCSACAGVPPYESEPYECDTCGKPSIGLVRSRGPQVAGGGGRGIDRPEDDDDPRVVDMTGGLRYGHTLGTPVIIPGVTDSNTLPDPPETQEPGANCLRCDGAGCPDCQPHPGDTL